MKRVTCKVVSVEPILDDIFNIELKPESPQTFIAGQYLQMVMAEDDKRPFSIASSPEQTDLIELHIGAPETNSYARQVIEKLQHSGEVEIELPFGKAGYRVDSALPLLLMVGGTGFAYAKSIVEHIIDTEQDRKIYLYWGGRNMGGLYLNELAYQWQELDRVHFVPVLEHAVPQWTGKRGLVHEAVLEDFEDMSGLEVYIAGRFEMAALAREAFTARGLPAEQLHGDAYEFI
ncbi:NAD(P)H-flavin reductase [Aliagarivorans marinus]|uniref:NAD(P)H-flavin reductase n=1 Tax=Aliagarivorans marinus TaxID=561965 RepID=UPI000418D554|nr:NAD(P)H-flavin reductase [Aliagarivorans marinus]